MTAVEPPPDMESGVAVWVTLVFFVIVAIAVLCVVQP